jgi:hypothetical protein
MMRQLRPTCTHCIHWVADNTADTPTAGHCHRYPPGIFVNPQTGTIVQKFPTTDRHCWCGEWNGDEARWIEALHRLTASCAAPHARSDVPHSL